MNIQYKITESKKMDVFSLYHEGLFYKCYNEDAMVFVQKIKRYKVLSKFIKSVGEDVLSIGFPVSELKKGSITTELIASAIGATKTTQLEKQLIFNIDNKELKNNYAFWSAEVIEKNKNSTKYKINGQISTNKDVLIQMIQEFDLANSTPIQGLMFVQELKKQLNPNTKK